MQKNCVRYALVQGVTLPVALFILHLESKVPERIKYGMHLAWCLCCPMS